MLDTLKSFGINMKYLGEDAKENDLITGKKFVITGTVENYSRDELKDIIEKSVPKYKGQDNLASIQRTFQAIRIEVNGELEELDEFLHAITEKLNPGGRLCVISFHSLEDRIVKNAFKDLACDCICPPGLPICVCNHRAKGKIITNHPIIATDEELANNRRSSSAKLRILEKL